MTRFYSDIEEKTLAQRESPGKGKPKHYARKKSRTQREEDNVSKLGQDIGRLSEIIKTMSKHGFAPAFWPKNVARLQNEDGDDVPMPERFCRMLEDLGPTFVKIGQLLSTRRDLLPPEFITVLSRLQDNVPPVSFKEIKEQIEQSLGKEAHKLFRHIDEAPLASASIAQVHTATLLDGTPVVIKVRRPGVSEQIERDSSILMMVAQLLEWIIEEADTYRTLDLATEFKDALATELDFETEAINLTAFARNNAHRANIYTPKVFLDYSSKEVLTMEHIHGRRITDLAFDGIDSAKKQQLLESLIQASFEHVFIDGLFHADPHPGNILFTEDEKFAFIDFGAIGRIARDTQDKLLSMLIALSLRDADTLARLLIHLGDPQERIQMYQFRSAIKKIIDRYVGLNIANISAGAALSDILGVSLKYKIRLPKELALLAKAWAVFEGIIRQLHPEFRFSEQIAKQAQDILMQRNDPRKFETTSMRLALQLSTLAQDLPNQVNQTLMDLERGEIQIAVTSKDVLKLTKAIGVFTIFMFWGIILSALLQTVSRYSLWWTMTISASIIGMIMVVVWAFILSEKPKVSVARFIKWKKKRG